MTCNTLIIYPMKNLTTLNCKRVFLVLLAMSLLTTFYSCKKAAEKSSEKICGQSIATCSP